MKVRKKLAVVALGGNALIRDPKRITVEDQEQALRETSFHLADILEGGWDLAIVHGNGPQVGFILRRSEIAHQVEGMHEVPLDVCGADTQGAIGYELQQALQNELFHRRIHKNVVTMITQTLVDKDDPAFKNPTKPIGSYFEESEALRRKREFGWSVMEDSGRGWRRIVASPAPKEIVEMSTLQAVLDLGIVVIAGGGGGIPVVDVGAGEYRGVAAVIDKDMAASLLAVELRADLFLIATSVERIALHYGKPNQQWVGRMNLAEAKQYLSEGIHFGTGSMAPKIQAVIQYLEAGGKKALITNPENIGRAMRQETGTIIEP